jgi:hypothetical protein
LFTLNDGTLDIIAGTMTKNRWAFSFMGSW